MPFLNSTLFSVLFTIFLVLPSFKTKNEIRCIDVSKYAFTHRNLPESEKYIWIIQNVHEKSGFFTETVQFLERSLSSMLMIAAAWLAVNFFV